MKREVLWRVAVATLVCGVMIAPTASAQVFHAFPGAPVVGNGNVTLGSALGFGDNLLRIVGYGRFNVSPVADFGLEVVFDDLHEHWRSGAAADFRYAIVPTGATLPFDVTVGGGLGVQSGADYSNVTIPVGGLISRPFHLNNGRSLIPYGGFYLMYLHYSDDYFGDSKLEVELRAGASYAFRADTGLSAAVHIGDVTVFYVGLTKNL